MPLDFTSYLSFIQIFIELNLSFFILDRYNLLLRIQKGMINEYKDSMSPLQQRAQEFLLKRNSVVDFEWIRRKGILRKTTVKCLYGRDEERAGASLYWNSLAPLLAVVTVFMSVLLLFEIAELRYDNTLSTLNIILLTSQATLIASVIMVYLFYRMRERRTSLLVFIAVLWETVAIAVGYMMVCMGWFYPVLDNRYIFYIIKVLIWFPVIPFLVYLYKLLMLYLTMYNDYKKLRIALYDFENYVNNTQS